MEKNPEKAKINIRIYLYFIYQKTQHNKNIGASQADLCLTHLQWKSKQYFRHHRKIVTRTYMGRQKKKKEEERERKRKGRTVRQSSKKIESK